MSDCSNGGAYYERSEITIHYRNDMRPTVLVQNKLTPQGERECAYIEVDGVYFLPVDVSGLPCDTGAANADSD